jgi:hypothetical protein
MKPSYAILLLIACAAAAAQAVPAGFASSPVHGTLRYNLRYSQTSQFGYGQQGRQWSTASGDASYANAGRRFPFTMQYGGGYGWNWAGPSSPGNVFQFLSLSQGVNGRSWNLSVSDSVRYTFQNSATGFSESASAADQTILTLNSRTLDNSASLAFGRRLDQAWSLNIGGSASQMRFIEGNGQDMNTWMTDAGISRRLNARDSVSVQYSFSRYSYTGGYFYDAGAGAQINFSQTNTAQLSLNRQWNSRISSSVSVGPQWVSSSNSAVLPSSTRISASASLTDVLRFGTASLTYSRGTTGGAGYMLGAETDCAGGNFSRAIGRSLSVGVNGSYTRVVELAGNYKTSAKYGGVQASWRLSRYFSSFAGYTAADQSSTIRNSAAILNGLDQSLSFGVVYSPREVRFGK